MAGSTHEDTWQDRHWDIISPRELYYRTPHSTPEERHQAVHWVREGVSYAEVGRRLGFSDNAVRDWVRKADLDTAGDELAAARRRRELRMEESCTTRQHHSS